MLGKTLYLSLIHIWGNERQNLDALGLGMVQLGATAGHLVLGTAVGDDGVLGAQTLGGADGVHSHVAATKDDDVLAVLGGGCLLYTSRCV